MIYARVLIALLQQLPPDTAIYVYEGEAFGMPLQWGNKYGWIEVGAGDDATALDCDKHKIIDTKPQEIRQ